MGPDEESRPDGGFFAVPSPGTQRGAPGGRRPRQRWHPIARLRRWHPIGRLRRWHPIGRMRRWHPIARLRLIAADLVHFVGVVAGIAGFGWFGLLPFEVVLDAATSMGLVQVGTLDCWPAVVSVFTVVLVQEEVGACGMSALWRLPVGMFLGVLIYASVAGFAEYVGGDALKRRWSE